MFKAVSFLFLVTAGVPAAAQNAPALPVASLGPNSTILNIAADGETQRRPDVAVFTAGVVTQAATGGDAMRGNGRDMDAVIAALRRAGIAERDVQTSTISLQPRYSNPHLEAEVAARQRNEAYIPSQEALTPRIIGYEARNQVQVRVRDLDRMGSVIDALIESGANEVHGPAFTLDDPRTALDEARTAAIANGRQRAELYARAAGLRVGRILSIAEGGGFYSIDQALMVTGGRISAPPAPPPTPVSPGELNLRVNVSMQFELVR